MKILTECGDLRFYLDGVTADLGDWHEVGARHDAEGNFMAPDDAADRVRAMRRERAARPKIVSLPESFYREDRDGARGGSL